MRYSVKRAESLSFEWGRYVKYIVSQEEDGFTIYIGPNGSVSHASIAKSFGVTTRIIGGGNIHSDADGAKQGELRFTGMSGDYGMVKDGEVLDALSAPALAAIQELYPEFSSLSR